MPNTKSRTSPGANRTGRSGSTGPARPASDAHRLMSMLFSYEAAARENGIDFASSRFKELTGPRRNNYRAELVADYIKLSAKRLDSRVDLNGELVDLCARICEMQVPSHELIGTYLAAQDIVSRDEKLNSHPSIQSALRSTITLVLQGCIETLATRTETEAA